MARSTKITNVLGVFLLVLLLYNCKTEKKESSQKTETASELVVPKEAKWSERMALSEIHRFPDPTLLDFQEKSRWSYTNGLVLQAMARVYEETGIRRSMIISTTMQAV